MKEEQVVASLGALAHANRLRIFRLLVKRGPSGMPAGAIAGRVPGGRGAVRGRSACRCRLGALCLPLAGCRNVEERCPGSAGPRGVRPEPSLLYSNILEI